jgi:hypothetical protein
MKKGIGIDIGTMNLVSARQDEGKITYRRMRDAFIDVPKKAKKMMKLSDVSYIELEEDILILGDHALETATFLGRDARRPLKDGLIAPGEIDSAEVLGFMLKELLGEPKVKNEICYFSVPAAPIDVIRDTIYHEGVFEKIITNLGYDARAGNEAEAIVFAECVDDGFSGIGISFGSGMTNVALVLNAISCMEFSVSRGGDWIDKGASTSIGSMQSRMTEIKEAGIDLMNPTTREEEALVFYYKKLIEYSLGAIAKKFAQGGSNYSANKKIPIIVSGGTSKAGSFLDFFKKVFEKKKKRFPIHVSEIRHASDPLNAVAKGLLVQAIQDSD